MAVLGVLVVDDDERILNAARRQLVRHRVFTAQRASDAVRLAVVERPHVSIVDLRLGMESGVELISALKPHVERIIACSGFVTTTMCVAAMRAGAQDVQSKPFSFADIVGTHDHPAPQVDLTSLPSLARVQRDYVDRVLERCDGNVSKAARILRIHRTTLQRIIHSPIPRE